jgi:hypothetical protein
MTEKKIFVSEIPQIRAYPRVSAQSAASAFPFRFDEYSSSTQTTTPKIQPFQIMRSHLHPIFEIIIQQIQ